MATQPTFTCATCDVSISSSPTFHVGLAFCCAGCAADGPCMCSYDVEAPVPLAAAIPAPAGRRVMEPGASRIAAPAAPVRLTERDHVPAGGAAPALAAARR